MMIFPHARVLQDCVLGPVLSIFYMLPLEIIIMKVIIKLLETRTLHMIPNSFSDE